MFEHPTGGDPDKVVVVAMGPSRRDYLDVLATHGPSVFDVDEVWGINNAPNFVKTDLCFMMDDHRYLRAHELPGHEIFEQTDLPVITSVPKNGQSNIVPFPMAEALKLRGAKDYFNHTVAYVFAYALLLGVRELIIFGADYISTHERYGTRSDEGWQLVARYMSCASYWLGMCANSGMDVVVTPNSPLLGADRSIKENFYGYLIPPRITREGA